MKCSCALVFLCSYVLVFLCSCEDKMQDLPIVKRSIAMSQYWNTIMPTAHETEKVLNQVLIYFSFFQGNPQEEVQLVAEIFTLGSAGTLSHIRYSHTFTLFQISILIFTVSQISGFHCWLHHFSILSNQFQQCVQIQQVLLPPLSNPIISQELRHKWSSWHVLAFMRKILWCAPPPPASREIFLPCYTDDQKAVPTK